MAAINSKMKNKKSAGVAHFLQNLRKLFVSRCYFANFVPRVFVPLSQRSENKRLSEQPIWNNNGNNRILPIRFHRAVRICGACLKWLLPEFSFSDRWSMGTKTLGTRIFLKAGIHMKAVFWMDIMFLMQISRLRFKQSRISMLISHIYVLGRVV